MRISRTRAAAIAAVASISLVAACGGDDDSADAEAPPTSEPAATDAVGTEPMGTEPTNSDMAEGMGPTGSACGSVPTDGEGSFAGMADDPAATAASNNPELSTLVAAVTAAGLVDTLNGEGPFTIFAPANSAFAKIPSADLDAVLADPEGVLTDILTLHVVAGEQLSSADLVEAGTVASLNGELTFDTDGDALAVNDGAATVVCADVPTANATVHIIDSVLLPTMDDTVSSEPMTTDPMTSGGGGEGAMAPTGPACGSVPTDGEGSFAGMADDPAATAASNNPELSTLVAAVTAAGLVDTLNGEGPFTIFAPANSAFAKIPSADLDAVLADPEGVLTDILTLHVVAGEQLSSADLVQAGTVDAIGGTLTFATDGDAVTVDGGSGPAAVVCADVPTANATVHIIDTVLMTAG